MNDQLKPYLTDKKFMTKYGFEVVDTIADGYELLALSFDGTNPHFADTVRQKEIANKELTIFYGLQCPYISNCISQVRTVCEKAQIPLHLVAVDSLEKAKSVLL